MHFLPVLNPPVRFPSSLAQRVRQALSAWGRRQWLALCAQAERPGRQVPYY